MLAPLLLFFLSPALISGATILGGIKTCKNDAKLNECILKISKDAIKILAKGDPKAGIPVLDPLYIEKIEQTQGGSRSITLNLTLEKININGLSKAELTKSEFDTAKKQVKMTFKIKSYNIKSDYILSGKFLVVPVTGKGKVTINLEDTTIVFSISYKLEKRNGVEYAVVIPPGKLNYTPKKMSFKFENLFNGDKALGDNMNKMLNENWKEFNDQLGPGVAQGIAEMITMVISKVTGNIPFKQLLS